MQMIANFKIQDDNDINDSISACDLSGLVCRQGSFCGMSAPKFASDSCRIQT